MAAPIASTHRFRFLGSLVWLTLLPYAAIPAEAPANAGAEELQSGRWWHEQGARFAQDIEDADTRSDAYYELAYIQGHAGDLSSARASAIKVAPSTKRIYALTFVARKFHEQDEADAAKSLLDEARRVALGSALEARIFGASHLVRAYVELDSVEEARSFIEALPTPMDRRNGGHTLLTELARQDAVDTPKVSDRGLAAIAYGYARDANVDQTLATAKQVIDQQGRDRAYVTLVEALVEKGRWPEAEPVAQLITVPVARASAEAKILAAWAENQSPAAIEERLRTAASREEKLALYERLIEKLSEEGKIEDAEQAIEAMVATIRESPRPAEVSAFGRSDDAAAIAAAKSNYLRTAKALAKQDRLAAARQRIKWAADAILSMDLSTGFGKMMAAMHLVTTQIEIGDLKGARQTVVALEEGFRGTPAFALAKAFAKAGDAASASATARLIPADQTGRGHKMGQVAAALIHAGQLAAARQLLAELGASADDATAYRDTASAMINTQRAAELHEWLSEMSQPVYQAFACIGAAEALRKQQQPE